MKKHWVISDADVRASYIILWWGQKKMPRNMDGVSTTARVLERRVHVKNADMGSPLASAVRRSMAFGRVNVLRSSPPGNTQRMPEQSGNMMSKPLYHPLPLVRLFDF